MNLVINIVDIVPEDMLCFNMLHLGASWYVARMSDHCEIFAVIEETSVVFIVWRNNRVVRFTREPIGDLTRQCLCIKCDYNFFIENINLIYINHTLPTSLIRVRVDSIFCP